MVKAITAKECDEMTKRLRKMDFRICKEFPSLEKLLENFIKKNNLNKPKRTVQTQNGIIVDLGQKGLFGIYQELSEHYLDPRIEADPVSGERRTSIKSKYKLEGILKKEKVDLHAEIVYEEEYVEKRVKNPQINFGPQTALFKSGRTDTYITREDNN